MSYYWRHKPNRRPYVNVVDSNDYYDKPELKGCPLCAIALHYDQKRDLYWCLHCGWNRPTDFINNNIIKDDTSIIEQPTTKLKTAISADKDAATADPDNIPVASKGSRTDEIERKRRYPFEDIMDADDKKYIKQGHTLISLTEDMPTTRDKEVLSKEELDNEREEKGGVTKRSTFFLRRGQH